MAGKRVAPQKPERILNRIDQRPIEFEQLAPNPARQYNPSHDSGFRTALGELAPKLRELHRVPTLQLCQAGFESGESVGVGKDLGCLLQGVVLIDRDQNSRRFAVAGDEHVVAPVGDIAQQLAEIAAELSNRDGFRHVKSVHVRVHKAKDHLSPNPAPRHSPTRLRHPRRRWTQMPRTWP